MLANLSKGQGNLLGFGVCAGMMAYALYSQHVLGLEPCNLCIFQRMAVIALGFIFLIAAIHRPASEAISKAYAVAIGLATAAGAGTAARHVYVQNQPLDEMATCAPGLDYLFDTFSINEVMSKVFLGSGRCDDIDWTFLGLSMPTWVLINILIVGGAGIWWNWRRAN